MSLDRKLDPEYDIIMAGWSPTSGAAELYRASSAVGQVRANGTSAWAART